MLCLSLAGLTSLPACLTVRPGKIDPDNPVAFRQVNELPEKPTTIASLIRAPGERIELNAIEPVVIAPPEPADFPDLIWPSEPTRPPTPDSYTALTGSTVPVHPAAPKELMSLPPLAPLPPSVIPTNDPPLVAAVRAYLDGKPDAAVKHLEALDKPNQELMLQLIPAVVRASQLDLPNASPTEIGMLAEQLREPAEALASRAPLVLDRVCFCRWVKNFGRYEPLPDRHVFRAGSLAELYVEVRNAPSVAVNSSTEGDGYVTRLACTLRVTDAAGNIVPLTDRNRHAVPALTETKRDFTRSPIRDYFLLFRFPVPVQPGSYDVTVKVHDPAGGREVTRTLTKLRVE